MKIYKQISKYYDRIKILRLLQKMLFINTSVARCFCIVYLSSYWFLILCLFPPFHQKVPPFHQKVLVLSCFVLSHPVLSCLVLSHPILSCLILSCLVLSCLFLSCLLWHYLSPPPTTPASFPLLLNLSYP